MTERLFTLLRKHDMIELWARPGHSLSLFFDARSLSRTIHVEGYSRME